jgi:HEAT repeat protein
MIGLLGTGGFLGVGGRKGSALPTLRLAVVQALGFVGTDRSRKALARLSTNQNAAMNNAVAKALEQLTARST